MIKIEINQRVGKKINEEWLNKIIARTLGTVGIKNAEVSLAVVGGEDIKKLNRAYRGKDCVTDVLSFVYQAPDKKRKTPLIGEIIICYPQAAKQAGKRGHRVAEEIKMLLIHGALHLAGYDHEKNFKEAKVMEDLQNKMVKLLNG
jgi:probable rRNA maturation factor